MSLPKKFIGTFFVATGFIGAMYGAYLNMQNMVGVDYISPEALTWIYWAIYMGFLASWYMLFDYTNENLQEKNR